MARWSGLFSAGLGSLAGRKSPLEWPCALFCFQVLANVAAAQDPTPAAGSAASCLFLTSSLACPVPDMLPTWLLVNLCLLPSSLWPEMLTPLPALASDHIMC